MCSPNALISDGKEGVVETPDVEIDDALNEDGAVDLGE